MNTIKVVGKYLDQPMLVGKFSKAVPAVLSLAGAGFVYNHVRQTPYEDKHKELVKSSCVMGATVISALFAPKIASKVMSKFVSKTKCCSHSHHDHHNLSEHVSDKLHKLESHVHEHNHEHGHEHVHEHGAEINLDEIKEENEELISEFLEQNAVSDNLKPIMEKAKSKVLNPFDVKKLYSELEQKKSGKEFLDKFIPNPESVDSKHIFGEIGKLSILGFVPVAGGIAGGIAADKLTEDDWKKRIPNKIKEGSYQYLANIFLCNIGAGAALAAMEKMNVKSQSIRAVSMIGGIILSGVVFGSAMANFIGKKVIDPLLGQKHNDGKLYSERVPEAVDIGLHLDDVATVAVLSGLKWIEPALPILYSVSGYRAGIGYRNGADKDSIA